MIKKTVYLDEVVKRTSGISQQECLIQCLHRATCQEAAFSIAQSKVMCYILITRKSSLKWLDKYRKPLDKGTVYVFKKQLS